MKRVLVVLTLAAAACGLLASPAVALDYHELEANVVIVGQTSTTVSILITQTAGPAVTLKIDNDCFDASDVYTGGETKSGVSGSVLTFNTGPRRLKGKTAAPAYCNAFLYFQITGNTSWGLAGIQGYSTTP